MQPEPQTGRELDQGSGGATTDPIDLRELVNNLLAGKWWIAAFTLIAGVIGFTHAVSQDPVFEADALIEIEAQRSALPGMEDFQRRDSPASAQIQILRSRSVLGEVVDAHELNVNATPLSAPALLQRVLGNNSGPGPAPAPLEQLAHYDWGGSHIDLARLDVEGSNQRHAFTLVAGDEGRFELRDAAGEPILSGQAGEAATSDDGRVSLFVRTIEARPGTHFELVRQPRQSAVRSIRGRLQANEVGDRTGIVRLRMTGTDREAIRATLDAIAQVYVRLNTERRSAEARESLQFVEDQLPLLRQQVAAAEDALAEFQRETQTVDLSAETSQLLSQLVEVESRIGELEMERAEQSQRYGEQHPVMDRIDARLASLRRDRAELEERVGHLPGKQREALSLRRELDVATEVYTRMLNQAQELRVAEAGTLGDVRIIDSAEAGVHPTGRGAVFAGGLGGALGFLFGCAFVLGRQILRRAVETPEQLEKAIGLPVFAVIPHSKALARSERRFQRGRRGRPPLLVEEHHDDIAVEALRSLRTALHFGLTDPERRVVVLGSPSPDAGKSFASLNLAMLLDEAGQNAVVVDGDMRRGKLAERAAVARAPGLADILAGTHKVADCLHAIGTHAGAHLLPAGTRPPNPSELLLSPRFAPLVDELAREHDWVIIDPPPVMAVTDAAIITRQATATYLIARAHRDSADEVRGALRRLQQSDVQVAGLILNDYGARKSAYTYESYYYNYEYRKSE